MPRARRRPKLATLTALGMATALPVATTGAASATVRAPAPTSAPPAFCAQSGPIRASSIEDGVSTRKCDIVGRIVVSHGMGVRVPKPGHTSAAAGLLPTGSRTLRVSNQGGAITVRTGSADSSAVSTPPHGPRKPVIDRECVDDTFHTRADKVTYTFGWHYNRDTTPPHLDPSVALQAIRAGNNNITRGRTDCPFPDLDPGAAGVYRGNTDMRADITSTHFGVVCGAEDRVNVVDWGNVLPFIAYTCWWVEDGTTTGADISFGRFAPLYTGLLPGCFAGGEDPPAVYDLQGAATHEWGHVYGLGHVSEQKHPYLTMSPIFPNCSTETRTLGLGGWLGMLTKYGLD